MKLGTKGQYAVLALADIARHGKEMPISAGEISIRQNLPIRYLEQLLNKLKQQKIILSARGKVGGYTLARPLNELTIYEIVSAVEESIETTRCKGHKTSCQGKTERCLTHDLWAGLGNHIDTYLKNISLADVCIDSRDPLKEDAHGCT